MFDFIHIATDKMVLAIMKKSVERSSWDIFYKPFHSNAWIMVLITTIVLVFSVKTLSYFHQNSHGKNGKIFQKYHRIILCITWIFFLVVEIYYEGAMTMLFTTQTFVPFHSIKDVMQAYPDWKLMMRHGFEAYYIDYVEEGDSDYVSFWKRVKENPRESVFSSVGQAVSYHENDPVVIHDLQSAIDVHGKYGDPRLSEKLEVFNKGRTEYYALIVTENSPLGPILRHGMKVLYERGVVAHLSSKWLGGGDTSMRDKTSSRKSDLDISDTFLAFSGLVMVMVLCFLLFIGEYLMKYFQTIYSKIEWTMTRHPSITGITVLSGQVEHDNKKPSDAKNYQSEIFDAFFKR